LGGGTFLETLHQLHLSLAGKGQQNLFMVGATFQ
jgi:hypothetical protein